jgi:hypothetical protein
MKGKFCAAGTWINKEIKITLPWMDNHKGRKYVCTKKY